MSQRRHRAIALSLAVCGLASVAGLFRPGVIAQAVPAALVTNQAGYLVGETAAIAGSGFAPNEVVTLQVTHPGGGAEQGAGHEPFTATADPSGVLNATWLVGEDAAGHRFVLSATRAAAEPALPAVAPVAFRRIALVQTDKYDYQPGETARITGGGFRGGERVTLRVEHSNGLNDGAGHDPFETTATPDGQIIAAWYVDPDDSDGSIFRLTAVGAASGIVATATFTDLLVTIVDDDGKDDEPGQKDLNYLQIDYSPATPDIAVVWGWDDTQWTGNNTGDACTLFDTDADGFANFSLCITVDEAGQYLSTRLYACTSDTRTDRCAGPQEDTTFTSTGSAAVQATDPFGTTGRSNNDCDANANCLTHDTVANLTVKLADFAPATSAKLLNVCSYPSREPNSDPSDCVVTPDSGFLTIVKVATPNNGTAFTFNSSAASQSGDTSWTINGSGSVQLISFAAGTYNLTEAIPAGWKLSSASCAIQTASPTDTGTDAAPPAVAGPANAGVTGLVIQQGLETICTFTDDKQAGSITIVKNTVGGNGTFSFTPTGFGSGGFSLTTPGSPSQTFGNLAPGSGYSIVETVPNDWELTSQTCTNGTPGAITVVDGQTTTCTFTNRKKASLTLVKTVINDNGGTAQVSDFTLRADTTVFTSGVGQLVSPATYALSESTAVTGYTPSAWSCVGFTNGGSLSGSSVTLGAGETVTCTITNNDNAPSLTLVKQVTNNNGGTAAPSAFTLSASGPTPISGAGGATSGATFRAGTYTLSESSVPGYAATPAGWVCTGTGTQTGSSIALALGQSATCTITNDDLPPSLTLVKQVTNDNGGTAAPADFTLSATGPTPISGAGGATSNGTFSAGTYALGETSVPGYAPTAAGWVCTGNGTQTGSSIALALGQSATCTIINDDQPPSLTLVKQVVNDNGGTAAAADFTLTATGPTSISGAGGATSGPSFDAGTYALSETTLPGYTAGSWSCVGGAQTGDSVVVALGQNVTCTIVNNDRIPSLTLVKVVQNNWGGTAVAANFTLSANGPTPISGAGGATSGPAFQTGTYALSETSLTGYTASAWVCTGTGTQNNGSITLGLGQSAICTITNSDIPASLTVQKVCNPTGDTGRFNLLIDLVGSTDTACGGSYNRLVSAGLHNVSETGGTGTTLSEYVTTVNGACASNGNITLALGQSATCTITNTRKASVDVLKTTRGVALENPLPGQPGFWTFTLLGPGINASHTTPPPLFDFDGDASLNVPKLTPGEVYTLCETSLPAAWTVRVEINIGGVWTIIPQVFNTNTSAVGPDGYSQVFDPNFLPPPQIFTNDTRCVRFVALPGQTISFRIDNSFPGGEPRTIGFWKNWNTCTNGRQQQTAAQNGGAAAGFYILDDLLNDPGYTLGLLLLDDGDCVQAVRILDKSDIVSGQKKASDPAYNMAAQLLAAMLNYSAGAETCAAASAAITEGQAVLTLYNFNGTGNYAKKGTLADRALAVTPILDAYNNGFLCQ